MKTIGIIVGRFQTPELHAGHRHLIEEVRRRAGKVLIVIGSPAGLPSARNPLPYALRRDMILAAYPEVHIAELIDEPCDNAWSTKLDLLMTGMFPNHTATLYGSRDSFLDYYRGPFARETIAPIDAPSGTDMRKAACKTVHQVADTAYRAGIISAHATRLPVSYQTVDIAIINPTRRLVLLAHKKSDGDKLRFPGGFVDASDASLERAAAREAREECGDLELADMTYLGSFRQDDWRYRGERDQIMTTLFVATYCFGPATAGDDIDDVAWVPFDEVEARIVDTHTQLAKRFVAHVTSIK